MPNSCLFAYFHFISFSQFSPLTTYGLIQKAVLLINYLLFIVINNRTENWFPNMLVTKVVCVAGISQVSGFLVCSSFK